ncbi:MAG: hypothetical protein Q4B27_03310 [Candidatus Saccharibacteria bacterium]|nr:hypothetical protein [Candidatus Saccharibacteria bacterium]
MYNKPPREQARHYDIQWYRQTGVFHPEQLSSETPTVGVSANTWREYINLIRQAAADNPAHRFISPELMTTADMELAEIPDQHAVVNDRLAELQELSTSMPAAELVVGTPEYQPHSTYNSLMIITNGIRYVLERKRTIFSSAERGTFTASNTLQQRYTRTLSAVCADLVGYGMQYPQYPKLPQDTRAIHASCCWATPREEGARYAAAPDEERYTSAMTHTLGHLFTHYPQLQQIMVVDRTPSSTAIPPLNCVAQRNAHNGIIES